jgi:CheY-like chemotaxis protein
MNDLDSSSDLQAPRAAHQPLPLVPPRESLKIALAEDNGALRRLLTLILLREGHEVVETRDAGELLDQMASSYTGDEAAPFDLVICEQALPGIAGLSVLAGLRARAIKTPFILIASDQVVQVRARRLGAVVLDHPFTRAGIRSAVRQAYDVPLPAND